jgi:AAHS family 4-hydroxybenzoate transporter-like MFS transporter
VPESRSVVSAESFASGARPSSPSTSSVGLRSPFDVSRALDDGRFSPYQVWLVVLTALAIVFDGFDNQLLGLALPAIMRDWGLDRSTFAPVVSLGYVGMMIGGGGAGLAGDRFGRRTALVGSTLAFGLATAVVSRVDGPGALAAVRFVAGVGLGGAIPNGAALAAEFVPQRQRPLAVTLAILCVPVGGTLAGLFAVPALASLGWRGMFVIGGLAPVALALLLAAILPESPRYLARHPRRWTELGRLLDRLGHRVGADAAFTVSHDDAGRSAPLEALLGRGLRIDTLALWVSFLSCLLTVYLGFVWLPSMLVEAGFSEAVASLGLTMFNFGGVVAAVGGGALVARFGSRLVMLPMAGGAILGALAAGLMAAIDQLTVFAILTLLAVIGGLVNAVQITMYALAAHVYPTPVRATGVGAASAVGRTGAILAGYAGPWALAHGGAASFFGLMAAMLAVTFTALAVLRRHIVPR